MCLSAESKVWSLFSFRAHFQISILNVSTPRLFAIRPDFVLDQGQLDPWTFSSAAFIQPLLGFWVMPGLRLHLSMDLFSSWRKTALGLKGECQKGVGEWEIRNFSLHFFAFPETFLFWQKLFVYVCNLLGLKPIELVQWKTHLLHFRMMPFAPKPRKINRPTKLSRLNIYLCLSNNMNSFLSLRDKMHFLKVNVSQSSFHTWLLIQSSMSQEWVFARIYLRLLRTIECPSDWEISPE